MTRLFRFVCVGGTSTVVYTLILSLIKESMNPPIIVATTLAYCSAMIFSFLGHRNVTFRSTTNVRHQLVRYAIVYTVGLVLAYFIMELSTKEFHLHYFFGILAVDVVLPLFSFVFMVVFVFADRVHVIVGRSSLR